MKTKLLAIALILLSNLSFAQNTVTTPGFFFSPANLTVEEGTTVIFDLGDAHDAQQAEDATSIEPMDGGFYITFGGGEFTFEEPGVYYYYCTAHTNMKGTITVTAVTGNRASETISLLEVYPNPSQSNTQLKFGLANGADVEVLLFDAMGVKVLELGKRSLTAGEHRLDLDVTSLENGIYTATLVVNGERAVNRKIVVKK